jgi:hypothetical protein
MVAIKTVILSVALAAVAVNAQEIPEGQTTLPAATVEVGATVTSTVDTAVPEAEATDAAATDAADVDAATPTGTPAGEEETPADGEPPADAEPTAVAEPTGDAEPPAGAEPTGDAEPPADAEPTAEETATATEAPATEPTPVESPEAETPGEDDGPEATAVIPIEASVTGTQTVVVATGDAGAAPTNGTVNTGAPGATEPASFEGAASILSWSKEIAVVGAALFGFAVLF